MQEENSLWHWWHLWRICAEDAGIPPPHSGTCGLGQSCPNLPTRGWIGDRCSCPRLLFKEGCSEAKGDLYFASVEQPLWAGLSDFSGSRGGHLWQGWIKCINCSVGTFMHAGPRNWDNIGSHVAWASLHERTAGLIGRTWRPPLLIGVLYCNLTSGALRLVVRISWLYMKYCIKPKSEEAAKLRLTIWWSTLAGQPWKSII